MPQLYNTKKYSDDWIREVWSMFPKSFDTQASMHVLTPNAYRMLLNRRNMYDELIFFTFKDVSRDQLTKMAKTRPIDIVRKLGLDDNMYRMFTRYLINLGLKKPRRRSKKTKSRSKASRVQSLSENSQPTQASNDTLGETAAAEVDHAFSDETAAAEVERLPLDETTTADVEIESPDLSHLFDP